MWPCTHRPPDEPVLGYGSCFFSLKVCLRLGAQDDSELLGKRQSVPVCAQSFFECPMSSLPPPSPRLNHPLSDIHQRMKSTRTAAIYPEEVLVSCFNLLAQKQPLSGTHFFAVLLGLCVSMNTVASRSGVRLSYHRIAHCDISREVNRMIPRSNPWCPSYRTLAIFVAAACGSVVSLAQQSARRTELWPGNLVFSRSVYDNRS
jgi:hypothetical protein